MSKSGAPEEIAAHRGLTSMPEAWVDLVHGRLSADQARSQALADESPALAERSARMLSPPSGAQSRARLDALLDAHFPAPPSRSTSGPLVLGVVAMAAAAALLLVMPRSLPEPEGPAFEAGYALELHRALALEREADSGIDPDPDAAEPRPQYRADRRVQLTLRPAHRVSGPVAVRAFAADPRGHTRVVPVEPTISALGVVEILGTPRAWGLTPGPWQLTLVVGPPATLPQAAAQVRDDDRAPYDVQRAWIEVLAEAPR